MSKGQRITVDGQSVTIEATDRSNFGRIAYFRLDGVYQWEYVSVLTGGREREIEKMSNRWQPVECRDNDPERVYWRISRRNPETQEREYGLSEDENGRVLEFENREQAQSVCDSRNGSDFVYDDENEIRIKRGKNRDKAVIKPRVGPEALSAILADLDDDD